MKSGNDLGPYVFFCFAVALQSVSPEPLDSSAEEGAKAKSSLGASAFASFWCM